MIITPTHLTVGQLFDQQFIFRVPKYQRFYAWDSDEIDDFLEDLDQCQEARRLGQDKHHFFGGLVTVNSPYQGSARRNIEVIDGQQRLASFTMLVVQLRNAMSKLKSEVDTALTDCPSKFLKDKIESLKSKYLYFQDTVGLQVQEIYRLELSNPDKAFFKQLIEDNDPNVGRDSHKLLVHAYRSIGAFLEKLLAKYPTDIEKALALSRIDEVLQSDWTIIHMSTDSKHEAYMMFQVLNDRGKDLTEGELLRARTLEMLDMPQFQEKLDAVELLWNEMLKKNSQVKDFLRSVYSSVVGKRPGQTTLLDQFMDHFFDMHKTLPLTVDSATTLVGNVTSLEKEFKKLEIVSCGDWPFALATPITAWHRDRLRLLVVELKHTNCIPLLLAACKLDHRKFAEIVQMLERFVFRYKIICGAHIGAAQKIYYKHAVKIRADGQTYSVNDLRTDLETVLTRNTTDTNFSNILKEMVYSTTTSNKQLKYFLMTIEHYYRWYETGANGVPSCIDDTRTFDFANTTIEHVYAQNSTPPDPALALLVNSLGNLTFLGVNDNNAAGNMSFAQKKPIFAASSVRLNSKIGNMPIWDGASIESRKNDLVAMALKVFVP